MVEFEVGVKFHAVVRGLTHLLVQEIHTSFTYILLVSTNSIAQEISVLAYIMCVRY
jgi:hypothetical protein